MNGLSRPELIATTDWLADNLDRPELRIADVRWRPDGTARALFERGHIPSAVYLDWANDLSDTVDETGLFLLAGPEQVAAALRRAGIGDGTTLVVYDDVESIYAARVWWSLRCYGFDSCRILDGGFGAWLTEERPISNADVDRSPATFTPRAQPRIRLTTADVRGLLGASDVLFVDARAPDEYLGRGGNTRRLGHIPGAVNLPAGLLAEPGSQRLPSVETLRSLVRGAGILRGRRIVCYDGSGLAATKVAFVLALLGFDDVAVYDGGWAEWGDRLDLPVER